MCSVHSLIRLFPTDCRKGQEPLPALDVSYPKAVGWGEASVSLVRRWIAACEEHENCRTRSLTDIYKTQGHPRFARIVDVQDGSSDPRLADADQVPAGAIYMTLSHCWGDPNHKPLTLTLDTLAPFKKGIPWNTLPKTFADAIVFTRNMGIRYIWIDSLCIIQDCADDWASQSAVMCEIYTGSYLNLAATAAADCRGGLFAERDERLVQPLRVTQPPPPGKSSSIGDLFRYYDAVDTGEWQRDVEDAPLCQRGWIVQERVLSRRCLHFGKRQLYWECTSMMASESVPLGYPDSDWGFKSFDPLLPNRTSTGTALVETWGLLLDKYTRAGLTEETDKLVAIAGLAKALAAQSGIQYRSGLWNYRLEQQLLWFAESPLKRPDVFRAPSWSWASTNSTICFNTYKEAHAITISSVPVSSASFTTFKSSPITIRGVLIPGMLSMDDKIDGGLRVLRARRKLIGTTDARHSSWDASFTPDSDSEQDNRGPVLLLPTDIGIEASMYLGAPTDGRRCIVDMTGIVLKATGVKGTLRRVGYFSVRGVFPRQHPLRKVWLLDHYTAMKPWTEPSNVEIGGCKVTPLTKYLDNPSKTNPLEGVSEDLYHHYEQIGDSGDQAHAALDREFDWSRVFSGGFTFDLV